MLAEEAQRAAGVWLINRVIKLMALAATSSVEVLIVGSSGPDFVFKAATQRRIRSISKGCFEIYKSVDENLKLEPKKNKNALFSIDISWFQ